MFTDLESRIECAGALEIALLIFYRPAANLPFQFIVMFRSRFTDAFPKSLAHFGPQELERGVVDTVPGLQVESLLCALLGLLLNRKQDIKYATFTIRSKQSKEDN